MIRLQEERGLPLKSRIQDQLAVSCGNTGIRTWEPLVMCSTPQVHKSETSEINIEENPEV